MGNRLDDPATANYYLSVIENRSLAGSNGALRLIKGYKNFIIAGPLNDGGSRFMAMTNLHRHQHRVMKIFHGKKIDPTSTQDPRIQIFLLAYDYLMRVTLDLNNVK